MYYHEDWLMRQIETMVSAIMSFVFRMNPKSENIETETTISDTLDPGKRDTITAFLEKGQLCEAENWLYENMNGADASWLNAAVYFYSEINKLSDEYLAAHDFSREEIESGLSEICGLYGFRWLF